MKRMVLFAFVILLPCLSLSLTRPSMLFMSDTPFFDIRAFGAVAGGADCTAAINSAIASAALSSGTVFIPAGEWYVNTTLTVTSNLSIIGCGAKSSTIRGATGITIVTMDTRVDNLWIKDLTFYGGATAIHAVDTLTDKIYFSDVWFAHQTGFSVLVDKLAIDWSFIRCVFTDSYGAVRSRGEMNYTHFVNCGFNTLYGNALLLDNDFYGAFATHGCSFDMCRFEYLGFSTSVSATSPLILTNCYSTHFRNCYFEKVATSTRLVFLDISGGRGVTLDGCKLTEPSTIEADCYDFSITNTEANSSSALPRVIGTAIAPYIGPGNQIYSENNYSEVNTGRGKQLQFSKAAALVGSGTPTYICRVSRTPESSTSYAKGTNLAGCFYVLTAGYDTDGRYLRNYHRFDTMFSTIGNSIVTVTHAETVLASSVSVVNTLGTDTSRILSFGWLQISTGTIDLYAECEFDKFGAVAYDLRFEGQENTTSNEFAIQ